KPCADLPKITQKGYAAERRSAADPDEAADGGCGRRPGRDEARARRRDQAIAAVVEHEVIAKGAPRAAGTVGHAESGEPEPVVVAHRTAGVPALAGCERGPPPMTRREVHRRAPWTSVCPDAPPVRPGSKLENGQGMRTAGRNLRLELRVDRHTPREGDLVVEAHQTAGERAQPDLQPLARSVWALADTAHAHPRGDMSGADGRHGERRHRR